MLSHPKIKSVSSTGVYILSQNFIFEPKCNKCVMKIFIIAPNLHDVCNVKIGGNYKIFHHVLVAFWGNYKVLGQNIHPCLQHLFLTIQSPMQCLFVNFVQKKPPKQLKINHSILSPSSLLPSLPPPS